MVSLNYHNQAAEACVSIASSSIDAIYSFHTSKYHQRTDRYSSVIYLAGAIIPLTCIIIKEEGSDIDNALRTNASQAFHKALALLKDISPGHTFARRMLQRLKRIVDAANKRIVSRVPRGGFNSMSQNDSHRINPENQNGSPFGSMQLSSVHFDYQNGILR
jgi:hypothetical protein